MNLLDSHSNLCRSVANSVYRITKSEIWFAFLAKNASEWRIFMEQEITIKELIALINNTEGEFIIHVELGEEVYQNE